MRTNSKRYLFPEASIPEGADFGIRVAGDSMEPVYHDGQIVWVQKCDRIDIGAVGIFVYDGDGYIKVFDERIPEQEDREYFTDSYGVLHNQPVLVSYNKKYAPRIISAEKSFQIVGQVL